MPNPFWQPVAMRAHKAFPINKQIQSLMYLQICISQRFVTQSQNPVLLTLQVSICCVLDLQISVHLSIIIEAYKSMYK